MDYQLPSWLQVQPQGSPADAFIKGSQAGSAIAHNMLQSKQIAMQQAEQEAMLPLRQQEANDRLQMMALDIDTKQHQAADRIGSQKGLADFSRIAADISLSSEGFNNKARAGDLYSVVTAHPEIADDPFVKGTLSKFDQSEKIEMLKDRNDIMRERDRFKNEWELEKNQNWRDYKYYSEEEKMRRLKEAEAGKDSRNTENVMSREKIASMEAKNKAVEKAFDIENHAAQAGYAAEVKNIFSENNPEPFAVKEKKAAQAYVRWIDRAKKAKESGKPVEQDNPPASLMDSSVTLNDPLIPVFSPDGKTGKVKASELDEALKKGYKLKK